MLSILSFMTLYLALLQQGTPELAFGIKGIQRKMMVSKTSDTVLLAKFKFSEWDQDGKVWIMAEMSTYLKVVVVKV